jgi:hypothetical protein
MVSGSNSQHALASRLLVAGVAVSFALLIAGLGWHVTGAGVPDRLEWRQLSGGAGAPLLLHLGILALIATPVVTVATLAGEFLKSRESVFALLCFGILLLLCVGLVTGVS